MSTEAENQLLNNIHQTLMELVGEVGGIKQTLSHVVASQDAMKTELTEHKNDIYNKIEKDKKDIMEEVNEVKDRVSDLEKENLIQKSSWKGPRTVIASVSAVVGVIAAAIVLMEKF